MDLKELKSSTAVILALGEFSTEIMTLLHSGKALTEDDERDLRETLAEIHQLMARIGYTVITAATMAARPALSRPSRRSL